MPTPAPKAARLRMCRLTTDERDAVAGRLAAEGLTPHAAAKSFRVPVYPSTLRKALDGEPVRLDTAEVILDAIRGTALPR